MDLSVCCYNREAFAFNTTSTATVTASLECQHDGSKAVMVLSLHEDHCQTHATSTQVEEFQDIIDKHMSETGGFMSNKSMIIFRTVKLFLINPKSSRSHIGDK